VDPFLIAAQLTLGALGVLGVATASPEQWQAQLLRVIFALAITASVARVSPQRVVQVSPAFCVTVLGLLVAVLFIGVTPEGSDAKRWLDLGFFTLQPSELMKVAVIAYLTAFFHNHLGNWQIWRPMLIVGLAVGLIAAEPNISTAIFVFLLGLAVMVAAGTTFKRLLGIGLPAVAIALALAVPYLNAQYAYIGDRLTGFFDRHGDQELTQDVGYQAAQAERYLQGGGLVGVGVGQPLYLPARDTDMIAISIAHALGLVGTTTLFALYLLIALRGLQIASSLKGPGALLAGGATTYICAQAALNLLVAGGLLPVTGVPLPFVSHGFNSLISVAIAMGFIQSAYRSGAAQPSGAEPAVAEPPPLGRVGA
jgi:cell division protein FtsW